MGTFWNPKIAIPKFTVHARCQSQGGARKLHISDF